MSKKIAHAPYNFVPLPEKIIKRYDSFDELPTHNASKPGEEKLLSGEVTFDIVAQSPILVADGKGSNDKEGARGKSYNFIQTNDNYYKIPGSTLRGLIRNTVSILSLSNWVDRIPEENIKTNNQFEFTTIDGIPEKYKQDKLIIDYERALFGFTKNDFSFYQGNQSKINYASRLNFLPSKIPSKDIDVLTRRIDLYSPNVEAKEMYLQPEGTRINMKNTHVRGMKHYWIKNKSNIKNGKDKLNFLQKYTKFSAKIKFHNLHKDELGLLLWAIMAPKYHQIGMAKPYGYGKVKFNNITCKVAKQKHMYNKLTDFFDRGLKDENIHLFIDDYKKYVKERFDTNINNKNSIKIFLLMKQRSNLNNQEMKYMNEPNKGKKKPILPTAEQLLYR